MISIKEENGKNTSTNLLAVAFFALVGSLLCGVATLAVASNNKARHSEFATSSPESAGFSGERLSRLDALLQRAVDEKRYPGVVALLARHGKIVYFEAKGKSDLARNTPMARDTIFRIASMSKPITGAAMMLLYEEGKWSPSDPIYLSVPEFAHLKVYNGFDDFGRPVLEEPEHPPTLRELMTHTAGFSGVSSPMDNWYKDDRGRSYFQTESLPAMIDQLAKAPLLYQPSTRFVYSVATDIQGYIIEKLSGMELGAYMQRQLFQPMGMKDTGFYVPKYKWGRLASVYGMSDRGDLTAVNASLPTYDREPVLPMGGMGLFSTAADYFRFAQMLLDGGQLNGVRVLSPASVQLMTSNHLPEHMTEQYTHLRLDHPRLGMGYGYNGGVVIDPGKADVPMGKGTYLWGGAYGTWFWVDPVNDIVFVGMIQSNYWFDGKVPNLAELSRGLVYQALVNPAL